MQMKKWIRMTAVLLMMVLAASAWMPAEAAAKKKKIEITLEEKNVVLKKGESRDVLQTVIRKSGEVTYTLRDLVGKRTFYTETRKVKKGQKVLWPVVYYDKGMSNSKPIRQVRATFQMEKQKYSFDLYYRYEKKKGKTAAVTVERESWYPNNTACSFGPLFRDMRPALTDKWYMFTPLDLREQGTFEYEYIASNMYVIGKVYVDVQGDQVCVTYKNFYENQKGKTETQTEYLNFFHNLKSVKDVDPESLGESGFAFGRPFSISQDLKGDKKVLMFVRNVVTYSTYPTPQHQLRRFWPNLSERKALRQELIRKMDK